MSALKWIFPLLLLGWLSSCDTSESEDQLLVAWQGNSYGYINSAGSTAISFQFAYALPFGDSSGLAAVNVGGSGSGRNMPDNGKWGFINNRGRFVINPKYLPPVNKGEPYDPASLAYALHQGYIFSEGLAAVRTDNGWIYINTQGEVVIRNPEIKVPRRFSEGLAAVYMRGGWGYINQKGDEVIEPIFKLPAEFNNGFALVTTKSGRLICIDTQGNQNFSEYRMQQGFHDSIAPVKAHFRQENLSPSEDYKLGLIDIYGNILTEAIFDKMGRFGEGLCPVQVGGEVNEALIIPDAPRDQLDAISYSGGKWGFINKKGVLVINPTLDEAKGFSSGLAAVRQGPYWGYIDTQGGMVIGTQFYWAGYFNNKGIALVRMSDVANDYNGSYAYINKSGEVIWMEK